MACPVCGNPSPCVHEAGSERSSSSPAMPVPGGEILNGPDDEFWRQEVVSRVEQHRARRRRRSDAQASLELEFQKNSDLSAPEVQEIETRPLRRRAKPEPPKIIQFPRPAAPPVYLPQRRSPQSADLELAEPVVVETPRILDAPEPLPVQMELLPAFADIQLAAEANRRPDRVELPLQPAAMAYRLFAGLVDLMVVLMANALFISGFVMFTGRLPQSRLGVLCGLLVIGGLWLIYQYLFLVYSSSTPGMRMAQLEICTFQGLPAPARLRRWRALASFLSALAAGLGFAWAVVDEDTLGWHDRITQTHLRNIK